MLSPYLHGSPPSKPSLTFGVHLCFQLFTHTHIWEGDDDDDDDDDERVLGASGAIFWLAVITVFIACLSEYLVDAIRGAATEMHVPDLFLGAYPPRSDHHTRQNTTHQPTPPPITTRSNP